MKTFLAFFTTFIVLLSCSTNNPNIPIVPAPPAPAVDTLGAGWVKIKIPGEGRGYDIFFANNQVGYCSGTNIYKTLDGGYTWDSISNFNGGNNITGTTDGHLVAFNFGYVVSSHDAGATFDTLSRTTIFYTPFDIHFADNNNGVMYESSTLYKTDNAGVTWSAVVPITNFPSIHNYTGAIFMKNANTAWIAADSKLYHSTGSLNTWEESTITSPVHVSEFSSLHAPSANVIYAVTFTRQVYKSTDGGLNFTYCNVPSIYFDDYPDIHFVDEQTGYISHDKKILKTIDGGNSWQTVVTLASHDINEVFFKDANHGWAITEAGHVLIYKP